jgi:hypothetical protein
MQFDTWASTYADAKALMQAISTTIDNYTGALATGEHVFGVQLSTCNDLFESDARLYRVSADYLIQFAQ